MNFNSTATAMPDGAWYFLKKLLLVMKLTILILLVSLLSVSAKTFSQINLREKNIPLEQILKKVRKQTGYTFIYESNLLKKGSLVSVNLTDVSLDEALKAIFKNQPLTYKMVDKNVIVQNSESTFIDKVTDLFKLQISIKGMVTGEGHPLAGVTVSVKGSTRSTVTNLKGEFTLNNLNEDDVLIFRYIGYINQELPLKDRKSANLSIALQPSNTKLDEIQVVGYGQATSQRLSTGSIAKISAAEIEKQPVTNVLQALSGQVPGLLISQSSGSPGSGVAVQIRAATSLPAVVSGVATTGTSPLYIIDGVPFLSEPVYSAGGNTVGYLKPSYGNSPLNAINPSDIENIEILKDADATSIYGSRGGNGVVLITTKKGKPGKTKLDVNLSKGISSISNLHRVKNMTLEQYLEVRRAAFANSGVVPTTTNAPDLTIWDTNTSTDFEKVLMGKTAQTTDASTSFSGGSTQTNFLLSGTYHKETTVIPGDYSYDRGAIHLAVEHNSLDRKFTAKITSMLVLDKNNNVSRLGQTTDLAYIAFTQAPNFPLYDETGQNLYWINQSALSYQNPLKFLYQPYEAKNNNLIGSINLKYSPVEGLNIRLNSSYNKLVADARNLNLSKSISPFTTTLPSAAFQQNTATTWNVEPMADYTTKIGQGTLNILGGATFQSNQYDQPFYIIGTNYTSDALVNSISNAGTVRTYNFDSDYKYQSVFGRLNYNWHNKYIANLNYRYDGSSKFGNNNRFGSFGSAALAWIFTEENWIKDKIAFLSYGKLRSSYGITGNDQIPNYLYLDTYSTSNYTYGGISGLNPTKLANPDLKWEVNKKLEVAMDLGFFKDRILVTGAYYVNNTDNPLVSSPVTGVTGFTSMYANMPARIQQKGLEFTLTTQNFKSKSFSWTTNFNISFNKSTLVSFPTIANTAYINYMVVGKEMSTIYARKYTGLSAQDGLPTFLDANNNGSTSLNESGLADNGLGDYVAIGKTNPDFFGGMNNSLSYKGFQLDFLFQFTGKSTKYNIDYYTGIAPPGYNPINMSSYAYELFKATDGKIATRTAGINIDGTPYNSYYKYTQSDAMVSNGAYLRLKNVALSYNFKNDWIKALHLGSAQVFLQGQNLLTFTNFKGYDPESPASNIPPLTTFVAGLKFSF
ncbi:TonB-dependent Receptor Plug Domain protein [compost metagenome]|uniref:SusC/RagA family TonB-linked outer membrane protein n=1 Tax=Pedobacter sp. ok626 TaxID=1761882 RepID=UPI0008813351|nr:SusC/RagA family TonB-linked outer membrane protein [Pedobacter sp. ok626]SDL14594.1 TonB-linked outer membrane protein, SusC/RagA family [Pedobacter sp. ok626]